MNTRKEVAMVSPSSPVSFQFPLIIIVMVMPHYILYRIEGLHNTSTCIQLTLAKSPLFMKNISFHMIFHERV